MRYRGLGVHNKRASSRIVAMLGDTQSFDAGTRVESGDVPKFGS